MAFLCDQIMEARGGRFDEMGCGAVSALADRIEKAERFIISPDVAVAAEQVRRNKPSTLLSAAAFARPPFPIVWIEYQAKDLANYIWGSLSTDERRPTPSRVGFLVEDSAEWYFSTYAWVHGPGEVSVCPIGCVTSYGADVRPFDEQARSVEGFKDFARSFGIVPKPWSPRTVEDMRKAIKNGGWTFDSLPDVELEALASLENMMQSTGAAAAVPFMLSILEKYGRDVLGKLFDEWSIDAKGEQTLLRAILTLINSRNAVESTFDGRERLNSARRKRGASSLLSHRVVDLRLSEARRRSASAGGHLGALRTHLVRGHFKVRKSGVFWWSPYVRGAGPGEVVHERYDVRVRRGGDAGRTAEAA